MPDHHSAPEEARKEAGKKGAGQAEAAGSPGSPDAADTAPGGSSEAPGAGRPADQPGTSHADDASSTEADQASSPADPPHAGGDATASEATGRREGRVGGGPDPNEPDPDEPEPQEDDEPDPDEEDPDEEDPDEEDPDATQRPRGRRQTGRGQDDAKDPAWRAAVRGSRFGQVAVVLVAAFAIAIAAWWAVRPEDEHPAEGEASVVTQVDVEGVQAAPVEGARAPAFTGTDIASHEVALDPQSTGGKPVWLMFVATWCTGCRTEMPDVQEAAAAYGDDVEVIVVYVGEDRATVTSYSARVGNDFTEIPDSSQSISAAYGVMGVPSHFFIDADGTVRQVSVGMLTPDQMAQALGELTGS